MELERQPSPVPSRGSRGRKRVNAEALAGDDKENAPPLATAETPAERLLRVVVQAVTLTAADQDALCCQRDHAQSVCTVVQRHLVKQVLMLIRYKAIVKQLLPHALECKPS